MVSGTLDVQGSQISARKLKGSKHLTCKQNFSFLFSLKMMKQNKNNLSLQTEWLTNEQITHLFENR